MLGGAVVHHLHAREDEQRLTHTAAKACEASFAQAWDNDDDAADDRMRVAVRRVRRQSS